MLESAENIWDLEGLAVCIPSNGSIRADGCLVMGRGVARQAKTRYPGLDKILGGLVTQFGNRVHWVTEFGCNLISFPVKHQWDQKADIKLIEESADQLVQLVNRSTSLSSGPIFLPRPGCGNGKLPWGRVKPVMKKWLDNRFVLVCYNPMVKIEGR